MTILYKDYTNLKFKTPRKTKAGSVIIDIVDCEIQTPWEIVLFEIEDNVICVNVNKNFKKKLIKLDNFMINYCSKILNECEMNVAEMYKPFLKKKEIGYYFKTSILKNTVLFESDKYNNKDKYYHKDNIKINKNDRVRFLIKLKKITINETIKINGELIQIEKLSALND